MADRLWYVAYGSNLSRARLGRYLDREPLADRPVRLPHELYFALESRVWTGGIAFVDHARRRRAGTLGRAWLLDREQFAALLAAESGRAAVEVDVRVRRGGRRAVGEGKYDTVLGLGRRRGVPVVTFTGHLPMAEMTPTRPARGYLATIADGLAEAHGLSTGDAADYLAGRPGVGPDDVAFLR